jgi:hypothetical protein
LADAVRLVHEYLPPRAGEPLNRQYILRRKIKRRSRWTGPPAQKPAKYAKAAGRIADVATIGLNRRAVGLALDGTGAGPKNLTFCRNTSFWLARLLSRSNVRRGALEARGKNHCGVFCGNLNIDQPPVAGFVGGVNGPQEQVADP